MHEIFHDDSFELEKSKDYILSIQVSLDGFSFSVVNPIDHNLLVLHSTPLKISHPKFIARRFSEWIESEQILLKNFREINIIYNTPDFTIIPENYYDYDARKALINQLFSVNEESAIEENQLNDLNALLLFAVPETLKEEVSSHFENFCFLHPVKILIENIPENENANKLMLYFDEKTFYAVLFENKKLQLANSFTFSHENDAVFYVLSILKQLNISGKSTGVFISGKTESESTLWKELQKYTAKAEALKSKHSVNFDEAVLGKSTSEYFFLLNRKK